MIDRIIEIAEQPAHLRFQNELLVIEREGLPEVTVPLGEIAALVVAHPRVTLTQSLLSGLALAGGVLVTCDDRFMPAAMLLPLQTHFVQAERFARQAAAPVPARKRLWQQIVKAKIRAQGRLLAALHGNDLGLPKLSTRVRSGDIENMEAQASRVYWRMLFSDDTFRRDPDREDQNRLLNYGYAVLRAITARAICGAGLHPSLGLHHHNRYDAFCLADDLMEPFRPLVDAAAVEWIKIHGPGSPLDRDAKAALIEALTGRLVMEKESRTLFDVMSRLASSMDDVFAGTRKTLLLPEP